MARYTVRRLLRGFVTMWLVVTVVFVALRLSGDPARAMLPDDVSQAQIDAFNRRYGLDQPIYVQYTLYLRNVLSGDFGNSLGEHQPVTKLVNARIGNTWVSC